jgi:predicted nucleotidyltransferase
MTEPFGAMPYHPSCPPAPPLPPREAAAALELVRRVRARVAADLVAAILFGSKARGEARPDSDVDILLVWRVLPPDREPQATHAEEIAAAVARRTGVPVTVWSVSLVDLEPGRRTPMLVDALDDGVPLWPPRAPDLRVRFKPADALRCAHALLCRVEEGSDEVVQRRADGDWQGVIRRSRDDVVRLCTALLLLHGETRPRRAEAVSWYRIHTRGNGGIPPPLRPALRWAEGSFGPDGRNEDAPIPPPPGGFSRVAALVDFLRSEVDRAGERLAERTLE